MATTTTIRTSKQYVVRACKDCPLCMDGQVSARSNIRLPYCIPGKRYLANNVSKRDPACPQAGRGFVWPK